MQYNDSHAGHTSAIQPEGVVPRQWLINEMIKLRFASIAAEETAEKRDASQVTFSTLTEAQHFMDRIPEQMRKELDMRTETVNGNTMLTVNHKHWQAIKAGNLAAFLGGPT